VEGEENKKIIIQPIGIIKTDFNNKSGIPIQAKLGRNYFGIIELDKKYEEGLKDLEGFSHIHLIIHLNRHTDYELTVIPYMDNTPHGIFATRAPKHPNLLGLSLVEIVSIKENIITFKGVDILNNTPLIDIKPYYHDFDSVENSKSGWLDSITNRREISDDRF
jgi:tRNA-Thr(GGU) m(6)t(6)A37 methyltransferase TsaA